MCALSLSNIMELHIYFFGALLGFGIGMLVYYLSLLGDDIPGVNEPNNRHNERERQKLLDEQAKLIYMKHYRGRANIISPSKFSTPLDYKKH